MNADQRLQRRMLALAQGRPAAPIGVKLTGSRLSWDEPANRQGITHYLIRVGSDAAEPRYRVLAGQSHCVVAGGDASFWVSSFNEASEAESPMVHVGGTAAGPGSEDSIGDVTDLAGMVEDATDGMIRVTIAGTLPVDDLLQGLIFVIETPAADDPDPMDPTLPGVIMVDAREWYCRGDGSAFSVSFEARKPSRAEQWIVYCLSFGAGVSNYLTRLTQFSPPLPANATPFVTLDLTDILTLPGSGLGDVTLTGTPALTPTGFGTLRIDLSYIPPYLAGPAASIGDFQGVQVFVEYEDGHVEGAGDHPYLGTPDALPPDNLGQVSFDIPVPDPQTIYVQLRSYSTTSRLGYAPHATAPSTCWVAIEITSTTLGGGMATQVGAFAVTVQQRSASGVSTGAKQGNYHITYTTPSDPKWKEVWIERIWCNSSYVPVAGATWEGRFASTGGVENLGWWPWPINNEYWRFRARSVNQDGVPNDTSYPQVLVSVLGDGTFVLANESVASAMLQDLAVTARALADAAVTTGKYAPLSITSAAIGLAAINDANIYSLGVNKLSAAPGAASISAAGALTFGGESTTLVLSSSGVYSANPIITPNTVSAGILLTPTINVATNAAVISSSGLGLGAGQPALWRSALNVYSTSEVDALIPSGGTPYWGDILGTLAAQTDLQSALDGKAASGHNHDSAYAPLNYYPGQTVNDQLYYLEGLISALDARVTALE